MLRAPKLTFAVVFLLEATGLGVALGAVPDLARAQDETPAAMTWGLPEGGSFEVVSRGSTDEVLAVARAVAVSRVTLPPGAGQMTDTETPAIFYVESGTVEFAMDNDMFAPAALFRASANGSIASPVVVIPGTTLDLQPGDLLTAPGRPDNEPPYPDIISSNNTEDPVSYIDIEIFPSEDSHFGSSGGNPEIHPLDVSLGLETAEETVPDVVSVGRLTLEPGVSLPLADVGRTLVIVRDGTLSLATDEGEVAVKRSQTSFHEAPESVTAGEADTLADGDAAFVLPGTLGSFRNDSDAILIVLTVSFTGTPAA